MKYLKPICVRCQRFYRMKRSGFYFIEGMPNPPAGQTALPGTMTPEMWTPYKLWCGDLWECEGCGHQIVSGTGSGPVSEHYMPEFKDTVERLGAAQLQVNDC